MTPAPHRSWPRSTLGAATVAVIAGVFATLTVGSILRTLATRSWIRTACIVTAGRLESYEDAEGSEHWDVRVSVSYEVGATHYELRDGDPIHFGEAYGRSAAAAHLARFLRGSRSGSTVDCWYDPADATTVTLDRSVPATAWALMIASVLACVTACATVVASLGRRRR